MSQRSPTLQILSAAWGIGAQKQGCREGALYLAEQGHLEKLSMPHHWHDAITEPKDCSDKVVAISQMALQLARQVDHCVLNKELCKWLHKLIFHCAFRLKWVKSLTLKMHFL